MNTQHDLLAQAIRIVAQAAAGDVDALAAVRRAVDGLEDEAEQSTFLKAIADYATTLRKDRLVRHRRERMVARPQEID